jgi:Domain of unknown function (DUF4384)/Putative zinc-finger
MSTQTANRFWPACLSALQFDRYLAGELDDVAARSVRDHAAQCSRCGPALDEMRRGRDERLPPLRVVPLDVKLRRRRWIPAAAAAAGLAAAASLLLVLGPAGERIKGPRFGLRMYVEHGGDVRVATPGDQVAPGDAVRFAVTTPTRIYVAVLSVDPQGRGSVYFPVGARAEAVPAGHDVALPIATRLDLSVGEERILGLFCSSPVELEPLRAQLERAAFVAPRGCEVIRWSFVKR